MQYFFADRTFYAYILIYVKIFYIKNIYWEIDITSRQERPILSSKAQGGHDYHEKDNRHHRHSRREAMPRRPGL